MIPRALITVVLLGSVVSSSGCRRAPEDPGRLVLVGAYTGEHSKGIAAFHFDDRTGTLTPAGLAAETRNPSFLTTDTDGRFVFAVNEVSDGEGRSGGVTSFALQRSPVTLTAISTQPTGGADPCHLALDRTGRFLAVANYNGGNFSIFPVGADGALGKPTATFAAEGSGPNATRQAGPHGHEVVFDPTNRFLLAVDLGVDRVLVYRFDATTGTVTPNDPAAGVLSPGSGPRHLAFHPDGAHVFVINELASTITSFDWDGTTGTLTARGSVSTLPEGFTGESSTAEIEVHPNGRFLYASNRGADDIAVFAIAADGALQVVRHEPTRGRTPRHFTLDPTGRWLLAANQNSNSIAVFRVDDATGALTAAGPLTETGAPVDVLFVP